jgi:hypothetical protein
MNYMELSCNEKYYDNMKAKFGRMADDALEAANDMERQAKQIKSQKVDLSLLPEYSFETPNRSRLMTPATMTPATSTTITLGSVVDFDSD